MAATTLTVDEIFNCPIEDAFRTPILGDATLFLTGFLLIPPIIGFENDETWGSVGGFRIPVGAGTPVSRRGAIGFEELLERRENEYWKWELRDFKPAALFFLDSAVGEWTVRNVPETVSVAVTWKYTLHAKHALLQPMNATFCRLWLGHMKRAIAKIKTLAETKPSYVYE